MGKVTKTQSITHSDWVGALKDIGVSEITDNPEALTSEELAVIWKCHPATVARRMKDLIELDAAQQVTKLVVNTRGARVHVPAYVLLKEGR